MTQIGTVAELWRYPVKSMRGERLLQACLDASGLAGDRRFAFESDAAPAGKPLLASHERTAMLRYTARLVSERSSPDQGQADVIVTAPDGKTFPLDLAELLTHLEANASTGHAPSTLRLKASPDRPLTDVRPLALVSTATLQRLSGELGHAVHPQRFRSNLILELDRNGLRAAVGELQPFPEQALEHRRLSFSNGDAPLEAPAPILLLSEPIPRCRIVSLDPDSLHPESAQVNPSLLRHLALRHGGRLGVYARVATPGTVHQRDAVFLLP